MKHIAVHQEPVGAKRKLKIKVQDGTTGKVSWRSGKKGFLRDYDGDLTTTRYANKDMKISHRVHGGNKGKVGQAPSGNKLPEMPEE